MKIEAGKHYRTRDGRVFGPAKPYDPTSDSGPYAACKWAVGPYLYQPNGTFWDNADPRRDLVECTSDIGPVITETVTRIKPGIYGKLNITGTYQKNRVTLDWVTDDFHSAPPIVGLNADELRAAAATLTEIAEALSQRTEEAGE